MGFSSQSEQNRQEPAGEDSGHYFKADDADAIAAVAKSKRASSAGEGAPRRARKSEAADPMLPEKKRARRRLVGAIALALAVAVGLPMVLDSEPRPLATDIAIQIPSKDKVAPLPVPGAAAPAAAAPAATQPEAADVATVDATAALEQGEEIVEAPAAAQPPVTKAPVSEPKTQPAPEAKAPARAEPAPKPAEKAAAKPADDTSRALAILEGKPADKPKAAAAPDEKFVVQVGAFSSAEKVAELRARLSGAGIASYTQKTPSGATRVRVGPFATRAQADQAHAKLQKIGLSSTVVAD
ncbi:SPOR domain-containing protein [Pseudoduganella sp. GCM10020061]|uniref:SPOR domain-containing protein n=1 Tax=Pseudoduganella sp. GCM10020061 TaxID=3317345 RepID=UPI00362BE51A